MAEKLPYITFWSFIIFGLLSYWWFFFEEYGAIVTVGITFLCGLFAGFIAILQRNRKLIVLSILLMLSPWIMFLVINFFNNYYL
ncbi:hypothetical protein [Virgibacillus sp. SK37]|uniref:hypothetical protein n=1 Tax=Virgibacillus sp. SK37 TaxID=403957 RepID=UPI0004D0E0E9|nr:hypothetical protein [Virgibacillus sp. SK37]AIF45302.1 hypothetical protein X953_06795 [Virgibacillus sp. SK37]